ncbi:hypothetical protein PLESTF_001831700, partial [Pleodorina starrii]
ASCFQLLEREGEEGSRPPAAACPPARCYRQLPAGSGPSIASSDGAVARRHRGGGTAVARRHRRGGTAAAAAPPPATTLLRSSPRASCCCCHHRRRRRRERPLMPHSHRVAPVSLLTYTNTPAAHAASAATGRGRHCGRPPRAAAATRRMLPPPSEQPRAEPSAPLSPLSPLSCRTLPAFEW